MMRTMPELVDLTATLATFDEPWSPRKVAVLHDYDIRVVKTRGEFTKHRHPDTDEVFVVLTGSLTTRLGNADVTLGPGQLYVVPVGLSTSRSSRMAPRSFSWSQARRTRAICPVI